MTMYIIWLLRLFPCLSIYLMYMLITIFCSILLLYYYAKEKHCALCVFFFARAPPLFFLDDVQKEKETFHYFIELNMANLNSTDSLLIYIVWCCAMLLYFGGTQH